MVVGFVGVVRDLVFLQNLNKHFGCLGEQIYKKYLPTSYSVGVKHPQCCHDLEGHSVKASHNLGCEIFFLIQMNPVLSVELICLDIFFKNAISVECN